MKPQSPIKKTWFAGLLSLLSMPVDTTSRRLRKALFHTGLIIGLTFIISLLPFHLEAPDLTSQDAEGYDIYDLKYHKGEKGRFSRNQHIILLQIGNSRREIAAQLQQLHKLKASVIGLDAIIESSKKPSDDSLLRQAILQTNCVVAIRLTEDELGKLDIVPVYFNDPSLKGSQGYINFYADEPEGEPVIRSFPPFITIKGQTCYSFASRVLEKYDAKKLAVLKQRKNQIEPVNYSGITQHYFNFNADEIFNEDSTGQLADKIGGKIVLVGDFRGTADLHFTPLNDILYGKSLPDTHGVTIHANILAMLLSGKYIRVKSTFFSYVVATLLIFFYLFIEFQAASKRIIVPESVGVIKDLILLFLILGTCLVIFSSFRVKIRLEPIVAAFLVKSSYKSIGEILNFIRIKCI